MRIDGTLAKWNDDRGFGFIAPTLGGQEIFVHISAFPRDGQRPRVGEPLSFEIETDKDDKKRARAVARPMRKSAVQPPRREPPPPRHGRSVLGRAIPLVVLVALGTLAYQEYSRRMTPHSLASNPGSSRDSGLSAGQVSSAAFRCDGRTHCSQMTSCGEATFFLKNCPGVEMDGDGDGVPCEQQWCSSPFSR